MATRKWKCPKIKYFKYTHADIARVFLEAEFGEPMWVYRCWYHDRQKYKGKRIYHLTTKQKRGKEVVTSTEPE